MSKLKRATTLKILFGVILIAAGFFACNVTDSGKTFLKVEVDSTWLNYDSLQVNLTGDDGKILETIFHGKVNSVADLNKLETQKYQGGKIKIEIKGFRNGKEIRAEIRDFKGESGKIDSIEITLVDTSIAPHNPIDTSKVPKDTVKLPKDTVKVPIDTTKPPKDTVKTPLDTTKTGPHFIIGKISGLSDTTLSIKDSLSLAIKIQLDSGSLKSYAWDYDGDKKADDSGSVSGTPIEIKGKAYYPNAGEYLLALYLTSSKDTTRKFTAKVKVVEDSPEADAGPDTSIFSGTKVTLTGHGKDGLGKIVKLEWKIDASGYAETKDGKVEVTAPSAPGKVVALLRVTDDDGLTAVDTAYVNGINPSKASLLSLVGNGCTLEPAFDPNVFEYACKASYQPTAVPMSIKATGTGKMTFNSKDLAPNTNSETFSVSTTTVLIGLLVWNAEGIDKQAYQIAFARNGPSADNALSSLQVTPGALSPSFVADTLSYTATVNNDVTLIKISAVLHDATADLKMTPAADANGNNAVVVGPNNFSFVVTAQNGDKRNYKLVVNRAKNGNADLTGLSVSAGALTPTFAAGVLGYSLTVPNTTTQTTVTAIPGVSTTTLKLENTDLAPNTPSAPVPLTVGANILTLNSKAEDGTAKAYTITITRTGNSNSSLASLSLSAGYLTPSFASGVLTYSMTVPFATTQTTVTASPVVSTTTLKLGGYPLTAGTPSAANALNVGLNSLVIQAIAEDSSSQSYTVNVTRLKNTDATLSSLTVAGCSVFAPTFTPATTAYSCTLPYTAASAVVTAVATDANASVKIGLNAAVKGTASNTVSFAYGPNTVNVEDTAQDGTTLKTYVLSVTRADPPPVRMAYAYNSNGTTPSVDNPWTYNSSGGKVSISRGGVGLYNLIFEGQAVGANYGTPFVTGYGDGVFCKTTHTAATGAMLNLTVNCYDPAGGPKDSNFSLFLNFPRGAETGANGFAYASDKTTKEYNPPDFWTYTSTKGGTVDALHTDIGTYNMNFLGLAADIQKNKSYGNVMVSSDAQNGNRCNLQSWATGAADLSASVNCYDFKGTLEDGTYNVAVAAPLAAGTPMGLGYAWVPAGTASGTIKDGYSYNSGGGAITFTAAAGTAGVYSMAFEGLGTSSTTRGGNVQLSTYGSKGGFCTLLNYGNSGTSFTANFKCFDVSGTLANTGFTIWVIK